MIQDKEGSETGTVTSGGFGPTVGGPVAMGYVAPEVASGIGRGGQRRRERSVDLVLCDIGLPDMSGYDVARAVRRDPAARRTRLIALTGYGQPEDRRRSLEAGFDAHLIKPLDLEALEDALGPKEQRAREVRDTLAP